MSGKVLHKICSTCGEDKPLTDYHKSKGRKDGHVGKCKMCARAATRKWNKENAERKRESGRAWHEANKESANQKSAEWRANNPERAAESKRGWLEENRERHNLKAAEWAAENFDLRRKVWWLSSYKIRAEKVGFKPIIGTGSEEVTVENLIQRWGDWCFHCSGTFEVLDHYPVPVKAGGAHTVSNTRPSCDACNSSAQDHGFEAHSASA